MRKELFIWMPGRWKRCFATGAEEVHKGGREGGTGPVWWEAEGSGGLDSDHGDWSCKITSWRASVKIMKVCRLEVVNNHEGARTKQINCSTFGQEKLGLVGKLKLPTLCTYGVVGLIGTCATGGELSHWGSKPLHIRLWGGCEPPGRIKVMTAQWTGW